MSTTDAIVLIQNIQKENLYAQTIHQLNKDFQLANIDKAIDDLLEPNDLKKVLDSFVLDLLTHNYDGYLNLLYRIDVSEKDLRKISSQVLNEIVDEISYLILKREFQKVWLKKRYSK